MDYYEFSLMVRIYFPILTIILFSIIVLFGNNQGRIHSFIICVMCVVYFLMPTLPEGLTDEDYRVAFADSAYISILINFCTALAMTMFLSTDKGALKHALILCFAITINVMVIYDIESKSYGLFSLYFNELLILVGILQIWNSSNGLTAAYGNISELLRRIYVYSYNIGASLLARKKRETKT